MPRHLLPRQRYVIIRAVNLAEIVCMCSFRLISALSAFYGYRHTSFLYPGDDYAVLEYSVIQIIRRLIY